MTIADASAQKPVSDCAQSQLVINGPDTILAGFDGNYYFSFQNSGSVQRITPSGTIASFQTYTYNGMYSLTRGPDGNIWGTEDNFPVANGNVMARFRANGQ